jgi:hypothetical protein
LGQDVLAAPPSPAPQAKNYKNHAQKSDLHLENRIRQHTNPNFSRLRRALSGTNVLPIQLQDSAVHGLRIFAKDFLLKQRGSAYAANAGHSDDPVLSL